MSLLAAEEYSHQVLPEIHQLLHFISGPFPLQIDWPPTKKRSFAGPTSR